MLHFQMDENRSWLTVKIPIHPLFLKEAWKDTVADSYQSKILEALQDKALTFTLTELSQAMGYKGVTQKLRTTVQTMETMGIDFASVTKFAFSRRTA